MAFSKLPVMSDRQTKLSVEVRAFATHACLSCFVIIELVFPLIIYLVKEQTRREEEVEDGAAGKGGDCFVPLFLADL